MLRESQGSLTKLKMKNQSVNFQTMYLIVIRLVQLKYINAVI